MPGKGSRKASKDAVKLSKGSTKKIRSAGGKGLAEHKEQSH